MKKALTLLLICLLIPAMMPGSSGETPTPLQTGDKGSEVLKFKMRLFDLGYLSTLKNRTDSYTRETADKIETFQVFNGLEITGIADEATLMALYSPQAVKAPLPENARSFNVVPDVGPSGMPDDLPPLDEEGFLSDESPTPYVHQDRQDGLWLYISQTMRADIKRYYQAKDDIEWFEVFVRYKNGGKPITAASKKEGLVFQSPLKLTQDAGAVLSITDDFYTYRVKYKQRIGIVVRDGKIKADRTFPQDRSRIPSLEVLAMFGDGTLKTFASDAYTAQEYIDMGVTDTFAFGPSLVQEGEVPRYFYSKDYRSYREPRCALGMVQPGVYCALVVTGRKDDSRGAYFGWMAEKMLAMGAVEALNLDGGGTVALVFQGDILNKANGANSSSVRSVSGIIAFMDGKNKK